MSQIYHMMTDKLFLITYQLLLLSNQYKYNLRVLLGRGHISRWMHIFWMMSNSKTKFKPNRPIHYPIKILKVLGIQLGNECKILWQAVKGNNNNKPPHWRNGSVNFRHQGKQQLIFHHNNQQHNYLYWSKKSSKKSGGKNTNKLLVGGHIAAFDGSLKEKLHQGISLHNYKPIKLGILQQIFRCQMVLIYVSFNYQKKQSATQYYTNLFAFNPNVQSNLAQHAQILFQYPRKSQMLYQIWHRTS